MKAKIFSIINWIILTLAILMTLFAAVSGAEHGVMGLVRNLPNAIPWAFILVLAILNFKHRVIVGLLFLAFGIFSAVFFKAYEDPVVFLIIVVPWLVFGVLNLFVRER